MAGGLEFTCGRPRCPTGAKIDECCTDALVRPVTLCRRRPSSKSIARRTTGSDPLDDASFDELREVVSGLRATHASELLVLLARQIFCLCPVQRSQSESLCGFEFDSIGPMRHRAPPPGHAEAVWDNCSAVFPLIGGHSARALTRKKGEP
jgi:hypothetical protein